MDDANAIATVKRLLHRTDGNRHDCDCNECSSIVRVCVLASEAIAMKAAKSRKKPSFPDIRERVNNLPDLPPRSTEVL